MIRVLLALLLVGCGGDSLKPPVSVSFYGDSITSGASNTDVAGVFTWLKPSPVERINEYADGAFVATDYSYPGATAVDARDGAPGLPFATFAGALKADSSRVIVIRYATASALKMPGGVAEYTKALTDLVSLAQGRTVVLVGSSQLTGMEHAWPDLAAFEAATHVVAIQTGSHFIDISKVPGVATQDGVHPTREYSDAIGRHIAARLLEVR